MESKKALTKKGEIYYLNSDRGYGFIRGEERESIFFHASGVVEPHFNNLQKGNLVEYIEKEKSKGPVAINIVAVN